MVLNAQSFRELIESIDEDTVCVLDYARRAAEGPKGRLNGILKKHDLIVTHKIFYI